MNSSTFTGWNFANTWDIEEGTTYPFLKIVEAPKGLRVNGLDYESISLTWDAAEGAVSYQIEVDHQVLSNELGLTYIHQNLISGTLHHYRIRAVENGRTSRWSDKLSEITLLYVP